MRSQMFMKEGYVNMIQASVFKDNVIELLDNLYNTQNQAIEETAKIVADCIANNGVVHVFGSGHSVGLGIDIRNRVGSLVPIHIMDMGHFVTMGGIALDDFKDKDNIFERRPNVANKLYDLYDIHPEDVFIVISNSGINGICIDIAALAKENNHKLIVVTSMKHTKVEDSRHPSGKKLYMFGDVVIDNCGPHGDALLQTTTEARVCSVSSICNNAIAQSLAARVCELLVEKNIELPILTGDEQHDWEVKDYYKGRI